MSAATSGAGRARQFGTLAGLLVLSFVLWILTPHFLTVSNLLNVLEQSSINAIVAAGMTFAIISGGIDLSVGSVMGLTSGVSTTRVGSVLALSGIALASALQAGGSLPLALALALASAAVCRLLNGLIVTLGRLPPFIATLGMMSVARGLALIWAEGRPISGFNESFRLIATARPLGVPAPVLITLVVYGVAHVMLAHSVFGRRIYGFGGKEDASRLWGVPVRLHMSGAYVVCGLTSGVAAVVLTARLNSAQPTAGVMYELDAIAATVIGGTSLFGGEGTLVGALIGALIMGVLRNGLNLLDVSSFVQQFVIGIVIIAAVLIDTTLKRGRS